MSRALGLSRQDFRLPQHMVLFQDFRYRFVFRFSAVHELSMTVTTLNTDLNFNFRLLLVVAL